MRSQADDLGVLRGYGLQQPGSQPGSAVLERGARSFEASRVRPGARRAAVSVTRKQHVVEGIQIAKNGKSRGKRRRIRLSLVIKSRQGGIEVTLHGADILLTAGGSPGPSSGLH